MATRMQQRRGTAAQWTGANPVLAAGEIGYETDTGKFKIGNGSSGWSALNYYVDANAILDGAPALLDTLNELAAALGDDPDFVNTMASKDYVANAITNATVDQSQLAGVGLDWNSGTEKFDIDSTVVTLTGTQTLTNKTLDGAVLTGDSTAVTQSGADNSTKIATTQFVQDRVNALYNGAPGALDTLNELAAALGNDANFSTTITNSLAEKLVKSGDTMTGFLTLSAAPEQNLHAATKKYVDDEIGVHNSDQTNVHGITDTALLATKAYADNAASTEVSTHNLDTTNVHGITNTADLATKAYADAAESHNAVTTNVHGILNTADLATKAYADAATAHNSTTTNVHGINDTSVLVTTTGLTAHNNATTGVHGITDTADLVLTGDARLSDTRTPTDNTVSTDKIVNSAVTAVKLAGDSVTTAKIEDGAVTSAKIADGTIVNADINASAAIDWTKLAVSSTVSETELGYLDGVTSSIQTQFTNTTAAIATAKAEAIADATAQVNAVIASAPGALNTLDELAAALGDDANFATTITNSLAAKVDSYTPITQKTSSYTLSTLDHRDDLIEMNSSSALTLTIPTNATVAYPVGTSLDILQTGTGQVTIAGAAGVTVNATPGLKLRAQWSSATLFKRATDTWVVMGDLSA